MHDRLMPRFNLAAIHYAQGRWQEARDQLLVTRAGGRRDGLPTCSRPSPACNWPKSSSPPTIPTVPATPSNGPPCGVVPPTPTQRNGWSSTPSAPCCAPRAGDLATASAIAQRLADLPDDVGDHVAVCDGWLITGEILTRAGT